MLNQGMGIQIMLFNAETFEPIENENRWYDPASVIPQAGDRVTIENITYNVISRMINFFKGGLDTHQGISLYVTKISDSPFAEGDKFVKDTRLPRPDNSN